MEIHSTKPTTHSDQFATNCTDFPLSPLQYSLNSFHIWTPWSNDGTGAPGSSTLVLGIHMPQHRTGGTLICQYPLWIWSIIHPRVGQFVQFVYSNLSAAEDELVFSSFVCSGFIFWYTKRGHSYKKRLILFFF